MGSSVRALACVIYDSFSLFLPPVFRLLFHSYAPVQEVCIAFRVTYERIRGRFRSEFHARPRCIAEQIHATRNLTTHTIHILHVGIVKLLMTE